MDLATYTEGESGAAALTGPSRAAVLLLAMGPGGASRLLKHMNPDEIRAIRRGASLGQPVSAFELDQLVADFQDAFRAGPGLVGLDGQMNKLLRNTLSAEDLARIFESDNLSDDIMGAAQFANLWSELELLGATALGALLTKEHPQIIAFVLGRLGSEMAAAVAVVLAPPLRNEVMRRMLSAKPASDALVRIAEARLRDTFVAGAGAAERNARHAALAEIVNRMDKQQSEELIAAIEASEPDDAAALKNLLFAFEDLVRLSKRARLALFDAVPTETVTAALAGAADEIREAVLSAMAARARRMVEAELARGEQPAAKDVAAARRLIATTALKLAGEGRISLMAEAAAA